MRARLNVYSVTFALPGLGGYVPPDPAGLGGDYYVDKRCQTFITTHSLEHAKQCVKKAYPNAVSILGKRVGRVDW